MAEKHVELYRDQAGEFRLRVVSKNGRILETSSEGYTSRTYAERRAAKDFPGLELIEVAEVEPSGSGAMIDEPGSGQV